MIGVLTTSYPRAPDDGAGVFVRQRVRELMARGCEVQVVAAGEPAAGQDEVFRVGGSALFYGGGAPEAFESAHVGARMLAWARGIRFTVAMRAAVDRLSRPWTAVESHWLLPCGLLASTALPALPHRAHLHGGDVYLLAKLPLGASIGRAFCRRGPEMVFASRALLGRFCQLIGCRPEALGATVSVQAALFDGTVFRRRDLRERARLKGALAFDGKTLLAAGRLVPIKGFDVLVRAVTLLPRPWPVLVIAGDGPERSRLARLASTLGLRLRLPGAVSQTCLAEMMVAADVFVHPCRQLADGRSEGMPLVVREALACGAPVVASSSGGLAEMTGTEGLHLVRPEDPDELAGAIANELRGLDMDGA